MTSRHPLTRIGALLLGFVVATFFNVYADAAVATMFRGIVYTWPAAHGVSGKLLKTNGSKALTWDGAPGVPSVPAGVVLYSTGSCPTGWADYGTAGEYFVAQASGLTDTYGTALSDGENRATGIHTHTSSTSLSVNVSAHSHGVNDSGHAHSGEDDYGSTDLVGGDGTGGKLGDGTSRTSRLSGTNVVGSISVDNTDTNVSITGASATIENSTGTNGTNAPYIILRACRKS